MGPHHQRHCRGRHHLQCHLPRLRLYAAGRSADRGSSQSTQYPREHVVLDVLLVNQPNKRFATVREMAAVALFLTSDAPPRAPELPFPSMAAGRRTDQSRRSPPKRLARTAASGLFVGSVKPIVGIYQIRSHSIFPFSPYIAITLGMHIHPTATELIPTLLEGLAPVRSLQ